MKKVLIASGIALFAIASIAGAQGYTFNTNLTVGSTGADVVALQTWLMASGYSIPAIASGAASKGYFGSQTQTAVKSYQASKGIPNTGFVGPLTRGALNGSAVSTPVAMGCPIGYKCELIGSTPTPGTTVTPGVITTPGVPGTLVYSKESSFNNSSLDKGKSVDVAKYKLQASASDMQVTSISFDFNKRLWLYVSSVTLKDDAGNVVAMKSGLTASDFSELTVGESYRLTIPLSYVVPRASWKYVTLNLTALTSTDRTSSDTISITSSQARAVDGTGVNDTQIYNTVAQSISWTGSTNAAVVTTINSSSPTTKLVQVSTSVETDNVVLGVFDIKSQNTDTTLRTLKLSVRTADGSNTVAGMFNDLKVKIGGGTPVSYSTISSDAVAYGESTASTTVTFTNLNTTLPKDTYVSVTLLGKVAKNVTGSASTTLYANSTNIVVEDSSYASVSVNSSVIAANVQSFTTSGLAMTSPAVVKGTKTVTNAGTTTETFNLSFSLTAGDNAVYVSKTASTALSTSTTNAAVGITLTDWSVNDSNNDGSTFFYIAPGQTKTFTATYFASSNPEASTVFKITNIKAGTTSSAMTTIDLNSSDVQNTLKVTLF
jgi:peptidoglycan hydrolase-like protein with peptidoglycan-binding domain